MPRLLALFIAVAPVVALAQDMATPNRAPSAFNAENYDTAQPLSFHVAEGGSASQERGTAEY